VSLEFSIARAWCGWWNWFPPDKQKEFFDHFFKFKQDYQIEPVGHVNDMIEAFQAQLAKR
jgi:hypothetical protein